MKLNRWDVIIIISVLVWACVLLFFSTKKNEGDYVTVSCRGEVLCTVPLHQPAQFMVEDKLTVVIQDGAAHIENAICPDQLCQKHSPIKNKGESIVCLPSQIVVCVEGESDIDAIAE